MGTDHIHAISHTAQPLDVDRTLAGREVLVTGVTGFLGKVWVSQLLHELPEIGHLYLLIRGQRRKSAAERFREAAERSPAFRPLREKHGADLGPFLAERVTVLDGDCGEPLLGLDAPTVKRLARRLDAVVHFAGLTDFDPDPTTSIAVNTLGALHVADLVERCKKAKLLHCSTCYVAGNVSGHVPEAAPRGVSPDGTEVDPVALLERITETCAEVDAGFEDPKRDRAARKARLAAVREIAHEIGLPNIYTLSKWLAEQLLLERSIPMTFMRPAIVECATKYPFAGWNEGLNTSGPIMWFLAGPWQYFPCGADNHFDVIPVDTVSKATTVILSALLRGEAQPVYQLGSSQTNAITFERTLELNNLAVRRSMSASDSKPVERNLLRFLDVRPRPFDEQHLLSVPSVKRMAGRLKGLLSRVDLAGIAPPALRPVAEQVHSQRDWAVYFLAQAEKKLGKLEWMLDTYRPFIADNDYIFVTDHVRALDGDLTDESRARWGWDMEELDWRHYWIEVMYPGIQKWSMPLFSGGKAPVDPALTPPLEIAPQEAARATQAVS